MQFGLQNRAMRMLAPAPSRYMRAITGMILVLSLALVSIFASPVLSINTANDVAESHYMSKMVSVSSGTTLRLIKRIWLDYLSWQVLQY
jgi:hypothetical protein